MGNSNETANTEAQGNEDNGPAQVTVGGFTFTAVEGVTIDAKPAVAALPMPFDAMRESFDDEGKSAVFPIPREYWTGPREPATEKGYTQGWARGRVRSAFQSWRARLVKAEGDNDSAGAKAARGMDIIVGNGKDDGLLIQMLRGNPVTLAEEKKRKADIAKRFAAKKK